MAAGGGILLLLWILSYSIILIPESAAAVEEEITINATHTPQTTQENLELSKTGATEGHVYTDDGNSGSSTPPVSMTITDSPFATSGMKKHYEIWMRMIMESDFVQKNKSYELHEEDLVEEEEEKGSRAVKGVKALRLLIDPEGRKLKLRPHNINKNCLCGLYNPPRQKIVQGTETYEHHYPWMVMVMQKNRNVCGASIISDSFVLTAAHCTYKVEPEQLHLRVGDHDLTANDVSREVSIPIHRIYQHPDYDNDMISADISLMSVAKPFALTWRVAPICLTPPDLTFYKKTVTVMGWGYQRYDDKVGSPRLRHADLTVLPMGHCRHNYKYKPEEITKHMFCAANGKKDACQGDSGGPLVWFDDQRRRYFLIGVTSWGVGCGLPAFPGVYTKVSKFVEWIYDTTRDSIYCASYTPTVDKTKVRSRGKPKKKKKNSNYTSDVDSEVKIKNNGKRRIKSKYKNSKNRRKKYKGSKKTKNKKVLGEKRRQGKHVEYSNREKNRKSLGRIDQEPGRTGRRKVGRRRLKGGRNEGTKKKFKKRRRNRKKKQRNTTNENKLK